MIKKYFYISIFFTAVSLISFFVGIAYGFTSDVLFLLKPITLFQYSVFLAFAFHITSIKDRIKRGPTYIFLILGFFVAMASFYEILFNYFFWFAQYVQVGGATNLDTLRNIVPYSTNITLIIQGKDLQQLAKAGLYPINLNIASKISTLIFFCSLYWIFLIYNLHKNKLNS